MGTTDLSRAAFDAKKRYTSVRMQQGRVLLDDDFNDAERIQEEDERRALLDIIGPSGSPDDGFRVENGRINSLGGMTFDILAGTLYLGGLRVVNPELEDFAEQPDWLQQPDSERALPADERLDLVYLEVWRQSVTAVEDSELFEAALAGPDTSTRVRIMWRVRLADDIEQTECLTAWEALVASWQAAGLGTVTHSGERVVNAQLQVGFIPGTPGDLCSPSVAGGYLGAENQAIRVELIDPSHLTWGFDNAAPLYRVRIGADRATVTFDSEPKDQAHWPLADQTVEILPWSAVLSNGEKVAEIAGHLSRVQSSYDPDARTLTLTTPIPAGPPVFGQEWKDREDAAQLAPSGEDEYYYLRAWSRGDDLVSDPAIAFTPGTAVPLGTTGLTVTLTGSEFVTGDHWIIAARPETPDQVVPWSLESGRGVHGVRRFFTPLAVIRWANDGTAISFEQLSDCRHVFPPLTRRSTCCTVTVGDERESFGMFTSIQDAVNNLPASGGKVCVLPGRYQEQVVIEGRAHITVEGCGKRSRLVVPPGRESYGFLIVGSQDITIRELAIEAGGNAGIAVADALGPPPSNPHPTSLPFLDRAVIVDDKFPPEKRTLRITLEDLYFSALSLPAVATVGGRHIVLQRSFVLAGPLPEPMGRGPEGRWPAVFVMSDDVLIEKNEILAASEPIIVTSLLPLPTFTRTHMGGIQIGGGSERVEIRRNVITGGNGHGITLGSWAWVSNVILLRGEFGAILGKWIVAATGLGFVINDEGCIEADPDPDPDTPDGGDGLVPVSMGDLSDIRIVDNDITLMGLGGIGVVRYFDLSRAEEFITVNRLFIETNRIRRCLRLPIPELPPNLRENAASGVITLADGETVVVRDNVIERNGRAHVDPVCGFFTLRVAGLAVERNRIIDNAPRTRTKEPVRPGWRGGVVALVCRPPAVEVVVSGAPALFLRAAGVPALRAIDNVVVVPEGRCLLVLGDGTWSVHGNQFASRGPGTAIRSGGLSQTAGLEDTINSLGGCAVFLSNNGTTGEIGPRLFRLQGLMDLQLEVRRAVAFAAFSPLGGKVLFNDNQVVLDLSEAPLVSVRSSVMLNSRDDVSVASNQLTVEQRGDLVSFNLLATAWSIRINDNRFEETLFVNNKLVTFGLSALCICFFGTITDNHASHCLILSSFNIASVFRDNIEFIQFFGGDPCRAARLAGNSLNRRLIAPA